MTVYELVGKFNIQGVNQDAARSSYQGTLQLSLDQYSRVVALWHIGTDQTQQGIGFFKDNTLVINFHYYSDDNKLFKGTVVYKCLTRDVLEGFWSEEYGDPEYLGIESAYRLKVDQSLLN